MKTLTYDRMKRVEHILVWSIIILVDSIFILLVGTYLIVSTLHMIEYHLGQLIIGIIIIILVIICVLFIYWWNYKKKQLLEEKRELKVNRLTKYDLYICKQCKTEYDGIHHRCGECGCEEFYVDFKEEIKEVD